MAEVFTPITISSLANSPTAINALNQNFTNIQTTFQDVHSLSGVSPNALQSTLNMNSNQIINLPAPSSLNSPVRLADIVPGSSVNTNILTGNNIYTGTNQFNNTVTANNPVTFNSTVAFNGGITLPAASVVGSEIASATVANSNLVTVANNTVKSNISGGTASPSDNTLTAILDACIGNTVGSILVRGASNWTAVTTLTSGFTITPFNNGTISTGTFTPNSLNGNYQYYTNNGAHTLANPSADCAVDLLITNGASAGAITFTGFTVSANIGDTLTTTNTNKFLISIRRINSVSTYTVKALQ